MQYEPNGWVILECEINSINEYFVFASWSGSYLEGDSWRVNSGIKTVTEDDDHYYFHGYTSSVYKCSKCAEGRISAYNAAVMNGICQKQNVEVVNFENIKGKLEWQS